MNRTEKLAIMHNLYGKNTEGKICRDCSHLRKNLTYNKCEVYGISFSEATDFGSIQIGCGLWCKETPDRNIYKGIAKNRRKNFEPQKETLF